MNAPKLSNSLTRLTPDQQEHAFRIEDSLTAKFIDSDALPQEPFTVWDHISDADWLITPHDSRNFEAFSLTVEFIRFCA